MLVQGSTPECVATIADGLDQRYVEVVEDFLKFGSGELPAEERPPYGEIPIIYSTIQTASRLEFEL